MCGILACVAVAAPDKDSSKRVKLDLEATKAKATELVSRIKHRGPDELGVHCGNGYWMAHTRLSIVSPEHGKQPLYNKDKTDCVVVNGEVYNHLELRKELDIPDSEIVTQSDSEIIIHAHKKLGNDVCDKLLGMFSFCLVADNGNKVIAARDKVGVKPLYMGTSKDGSEVYFSSELKCIVDQCHPKDLMLVPAGCYWTREEGLVQYYNPEWDTPAYAADLVAKKHTFANMQECKDALEKAVIARCMADVEVGLCLSGGLDSSIIGAIMTQPHIKKHLTATDKIKSFAVGQEGSPDILAARVVAEYLGTEHIEALFTPEMAFDILDKVVYHMETYEPELIRSCIPNYFLAQKCAEHVKVVMTGEGSDEIWSGYLYYRDCKSAQQLQEENRRILKSVQFVNLQRCDRMTMAHSLEARVPFFDVNNLAVAMSVDPGEKLITEERNMSEKFMLRKMYEDIVPKEVVWRTKAMQCEGVGMTWVKTLQDHISNTLVSDADFAKAAATFPNNTPQSKEEYYYRSVFEKYYPGCDKFVHVWDGGCRAGGAAFKSKEYTRAGLVDTELLKKGHGVASQISV